MKYFININSLDELKAAYRALALQHHPDRGGSVEIMQEINAEHDRIFESLKRQHNAAADDEHKTTETAEEFRQIIIKLISLPGLQVELCGSWLWIGGDTFTHKEELKALGCRWSKNKQKWYWHHAEAGRRWRCGTASMADIRTKYGSQVFKSGEPERLGA